PEKVQKGASSGLFLSQRSLARFPKSDAQKLFYKSSNYDFDGKQVTKEEKGSSFRRVQEIGRYDCEFVKYPKDIPLRTRYSQTYTLQFPAKKATDFEVNRYMVELKSAGNAPAVPIPFTTTTTNFDAFKFPSPEEMRWAKPALIFSTASRSSGGTGKVEFAKSQTQSTHNGDLGGFDATSAQVKPAHELEVDPNAQQAFWTSRYRGDFESSKPLCQGHKPKWRKREGVKLVNKVLEEMGRPIRHSSSAPSLAPRCLPVSLIGIGH
ncbi:unnamed protein product, partial [Polarella glacialis]